MPEHKSPEYSTGTTIFVKKNDEGAGIGKGYTVEIYNNGTKVETIYKDTRKDTLDVIKQYKAQYGTSRSFQQELEVFVTYPEKDSVFEENKKENTQKKENKEQKSEASMNSIDSMLMKQAGYIEQLLNRITNPSEPVKIRTAEEELPMPNDGLNVSNESVADEITNKLITFAKKIIENPNADESSKKNDLYNKLKGWLFKIDDLLKKQESLNTEEIKKSINNKLREIVKKPEFALLKETLEKSPGNLEGKNQLDTQESVQEQPKAAELIKGFWKFASTLKGEHQIEDVFNYYVEENKIEDRKAFWDDIEKEVKDAFSKEGMAYGGDDSKIKEQVKIIALNYIAGTMDEQTAINKIIPLYQEYINMEFNAIKNKNRDIETYFKGIIANVDSIFMNNTGIINHIKDPKRHEIYKKLIMDLNIPKVIKDTYNNMKKNQIMDVK